MSSLTMLCPASCQAMWRSTAWLVAHLVQVCSSHVPRARDKVQVVGVMHFAQVIEAGTLPSSHTAEHQRSRTWISRGSGTEHVQQRPKNMYHACQKRFKRMLQASLLK